jgi:hypothetical protein
MTAQSDRTHSRWRRIRQRKLALLNHILDQAPIEGIDALKVQASSGKVLEARAGPGRLAAIKLTLSTGASAAEALTLESLSMVWKRIDGSLHRLCASAGPGVI